MTDINTQKSKPWYFKLHWQVLFALVAGVAFGWLAPAQPAIAVSSASEVISPMAAIH